MAKAGTAYIDVDAKLDKFRAEVAKGTADLTASVELDPDMTELKAKLRSGHLMADLGLDIDRAQVTAQLAGLTTNLRLDVDRTDISAQLAALGVDVNVRPDYSSLTWTRSEIVAYLSGIWVDVNVRLDATTVAALQAQLAALAAQAGSVGSGAAVAGGAAGGVGMGLVGGAALGAAGAVGVGAAAVLGLGGYGAQIAADNEVAQMSFERLMGSEEEALAYLGELRDFAAKTPFDFPGIRDSAARFLAVGVEADRVIPIMTTLGDATSAMGTGAEGVDRATTALIQMSQKGKVSAEEMMQLTEAGIPAWDALAGKLGVDVPTAMQMVTDRAVDAETMFSALEEKSGSALDRVSGGMEDASTSLSGVLSTMKDNFDMILGDVMEPILPLLKDMLPKIAEVVVPLFEEHLAPAIEKMLPLFETLMEAFGPWIGLFMDFAGQLAESLTPAMETLTPLFKDLAEQMGPKLEEIMPEMSEAFLAIAEAIVEMSPFIPVLLDLWAGTTIATANVLTAIASGLQWILDIVAGPIAGFLGEVVGMFADIVTLDWTGAWERAMGWANGLISIFDNLKFAIIDAWNSLDLVVDITVPDWVPQIGGATWRGDLIPDVMVPQRTWAKIPMFHDGGVFQAPMGQTEGLALLRDGETILTPEQSAGPGVIEVPVILDGIEIARASNRGQEQLWRAGL